jgi:transposase-like protein
MNLTEVIRSFGTEEACEDFLASKRWPNGVQCIKCGSSRISRGVRAEKTYRREGRKDRHVPAMRFYECGSCRKQFTVRNGTLFGDTHLPLTKWFEAIAIICQAKKGISANQLARTIGVTVKTGWYLSHRIREAMKDDDLEPLLGPVIEMDETYVGGRYRGPDGQRFHTSNKEIVIGIKQRGGDVRFFHAKDVKSSTLAQFIRDHISPEATMICTDELTSYPGAVKQSGLKGLEHKTVNHTQKQYVYGNVTTNGIESAFSLFKRGLVGSYHRLSVKHLTRYLREFSYKANNRKNAEIFEDTLRGIASNPRLPFRVLVDGEASEESIPF